jgi:hypothetical protein
MPHIAMVASNLAFSPASLVHRGFLGSRNPLSSGSPQNLARMSSSADHSELDPWAPSRMSRAYCGRHLHHLGVRLPDGTPRLVNTACVVTELLGRPVESLADGIQHHAEMPRPQASMCVNSH